MIGSTKLPSAAGIDGMITRNTMIAPCSVNALLYCSAVIQATSPGKSSFVRTRIAITPPTKNDASTAKRYITPIRLWSSVKSQERIPRRNVR